MDPVVLTAWATAQAAGADAALPSAVDGTFVSFPRLPSELRDMIWAEAVPHPEVIQVQAILVDCDGHGEEKEFEHGCGLPLLRFKVVGNEVGMMMVCSLPLPHTHSLLPMLL